jgi:signal transduction histidine kinase
MGSMFSTLGRWQASTGTLARVFLISLLAIIPMAALVAEMYARYLSDKEFAARREIDATVESFVREQTEMLDSKRAVLLVLAQTDALIRNDPVACPAILRRVRENFPTLLTAIRVDDPSVSLCTANGMVPTNFTRAQIGFERPAYIAGKKDTYPLIQSRFADRPVIVINQPLIGETGRPVGVVSAAVDFEWLAQRYTQSDMLRKMRIIAFDADGRIYAAYGFNEDTKATGTLPSDSPLRALVAKYGDAMTTHRVEFPNGERLVSFRSVALSAEHKLYFAIKAPVDVVLPNMTAEILSAAAVVALVLIFSGAAAMGLAHQLVAKPVRRMIMLCQRLIDGDLSARTALPHSRTDMGEMAAWLDRTAEALQQRQQTLEQREAALETAVLQAEMASRRKSDFLAHMSHELRTPLNAVIGYAEVIRRGMFGPLPDRYREYAGNIHKAGQHLLDLTNDILDLAAIEASKRELREESLVIADEMQAIVPMVLPQAKLKNMHLTLETVEGALIADPRMVKQILLNLVSNAIKYTPNAGLICLSAAIENGSLVMRVEDNGIGIPADKIETALSPYGRVGTAYTRIQASGIGLGLPLAKALTELHGGQLTLESQEGVGTKVSIHFPAERFRPGDVLLAEARQAQAARP